MTHDPSVSPSSLCHLHTMRTNLRMQVEAIILFKFSTFTFRVVKKKSISNNKKPTKAIHAHIRMAKTRDFSTSCQAVSQSSVKQTTKQSINLSIYRYLSINQSIINAKHKLS